MSWAAQQRAKAAELAEEAQERAGDLLDVLAGWDEADSDERDDLRSEISEHLSDLARIGMQAASLVAEAD